jgi:hypothetical protein
MRLKLARMGSTPRTTRRVLDGRRPGRSPHGNFSVVCLSAAAEGSRTDHRLCFRQPGPPRPGPLSGTTQFAVLGTSRLRKPNNRLDGGMLRAYLVYLP